MSANLYLFVHQNSCHARPSSFYPRIPANVAFILSKEIVEMNDAFWLLAKAQAKDRISEADAARLRRHAALAESAEPNAASAPPAINLRFAALQSWPLSLVRN